MREMKEDTLYQNGDYIIDTDNNYQRAENVFGRIGRAVMAYKNRWPAGRGTVFGNAFWERT